MQQRTFKTKIHFTELNGNKLSVTSPRTGRLIVLHQGWIPDLGADLKAKLFTAWQRNCREAIEATGPNQFFAQSMWQNEHPCYVDLTLADLKEFHALWTKQQKMLNHSRRSSYR